MKPTFLSICWSESDIGRCNIRMESGGRISTTWSTSMKLVSSYNGMEVQKICICEYVNMQTRAIYKIVVSALLCDNQAAKCIRLIQVVIGERSTINSMASTLHAEMGVRRCRSAHSSLWWSEYYTTIKQQRKVVTGERSSINSKDDDGKDEDAHYTSSTLHAVMGVCNDAGVRICEYCLRSSAQ